jgi:hypothetical protein
VRRSSFAALLVFAVIAAALAGQVRSGFDAIGDSLSGTPAVADVEPGALGELEAVVFGLVAGPVGLDMPPGVPGVDVVPAVLPEADVLGGGGDA